MTELSQKQFASLGGKARAKKLSEERRKEIAMEGVRARLRKIDERKKMLDNNVPVDNLLASQI